MMSTPSWQMPLSKAALPGSVSGHREAVVPAQAVPPIEPVYRTVIFATHTAAHDIPVSADFPASLLPLGPELFIERVFEALSDLGLRDIDLVVSDQPEALRQCLGAGERWGMTLRWHLVKGADTPYALLRNMAPPAQRVLIGHADHWVSSALLQQLQMRNGVAVDAATQHWCGWASLPGKAFEDVTSDTDMAMLFGQISTASEPRLKADPQDHTFGGDAAQLLAAQQQALGLDADGVPAAWIRTSWGAMSPDACVSAHARLQGPVLAGAGCFIHAGAQVGPHVVLAGDVIVASGARISHSLVMSGTFLGDGVALHGAIARGNLIAHVGSGERMGEADFKGSMLLHAELQPAGTPAASRIVAAIALAALLPWFLLDLVFRLCTGTPKRWRTCPAAIATSNNAAEVQLLALRTAPAHCNTYGRLAWYFGGMMDVLQGRRCWFGIRPRSAEQWNALSADWQRIFAQSFIGLFHAPAWSDPDANVQLESFAVADAYMSVRRSAWQRCRLCCAIILGSAGPKVRPATHPKHQVRSNTPPQGGPSPLSAQAGDELSRN
ncbi:MAG: hypothetical protein ACKVOT_12880 [Polaromonas sp.]